MTGPRANGSHAKARPLRPLASPLSGPAQGPAAAAQGLVGPLRGRQSQEGRDAPADLGVSKVHRRDWLIRAQVGPLQAIDDDRELRPSIGFDPGEFGARQDGRDYQVTVPEFDAWKASLKGHENVTFRLYPSLNHLFMTGEGDPNPSEYKIPGHVAIEVINDLATWLTTGVLPAEESDD